MRIRCTSRMSYLPCSTLLLGIQGILKNEVNEVRVSCWFIRKENLSCPLEAYNSSLK